MQHIIQKDLPTWLKVATTLKKPPTPSHWQHQAITGFQGQSGGLNWWKHQTITSGVFSYKINASIFDNFFTELHSMSYS